MLYGMKYTEDFTEKVKTMVKTRKAWKRHFTKVAKKIPNFPTVLDCNYSLYEHRISISEYITMLINTKELILVENKHGR